MSKDWAFIEHVTNHLARPRPGDAKHPTLWPSEATASVDGVVYGKCKRALFLRYVQDCYAFYPKYSFWQPLVERIKKEKQETDRYMLWIWAQGNLYEDYLVEQAKLSGVYLEGQVIIYIPSHNISGKEDLEVINPTTGKRSIVEAKSVYGFGGNAVLGTQGMRNKGQLGEPKDSNAMQLGLYHWWRASHDPAYEESRLVYGSRDTGRYAEFLMRTVQEDDQVKIEYKPHAPYPSQWVRLPYSVNDILDGYSYIQRAVDSGVVPPRDFEILYSEEKLADLYAKDLLPKTDKEQYEAVLARRVQNTELQAEGKKPKKELKQVERGDWQCNWCSFKTLCYDKELKPKEI